MVLLHALESQMELEFLLQLTLVCARAEENTQSVQPAVEARHGGLHATENAVDRKECGIEAFDLFAESLAAARGDGVVARASSCW